MKRILNIVVALAWSAHFIMGWCPHAGHAGENASDSPIASACGCCCGVVSAISTTVPADRGHQIEGRAVVIESADGCSCERCRCVAILPDLLPAWSASVACDIHVTLTVAMFKDAQVRGSSGQWASAGDCRERWRACPLFERLLI